MLQLLSLHLLLLRILSSVPFDSSCQIVFVSLFLIPYKHKQQFLSAHTETNPQSSFLQRLMRNISMDARTHPHTYCINTNTQGQAISQHPPEHQTPVNPTAVSGSVQLNPPVTGQHALLSPALCFNYFSLFSLLLRLHPFPPVSLFS